MPCAAVALLSRMVSPALGYGGSESTSQQPHGHQQDVAPTAVTETIVVTGSRIRRKADFASSNPIITIGGDEIQRSGGTSLPDFLRDIPELAGSVGSSASAGPDTGIGLSGLELLNLRNLGTDRTLVLVDGRRHVGAVPGSAAVDIDTIPRALIQDIEILTGGASAIYGADGVSGVVNVILRRDFEGMEANLQYGQSKHTEPTRLNASIVGGHAFDQGRGNITAAFEYAGEDRMQARDRDYAGGLRRQGFVLNPGDRGDDSSLPDRVVIGDIRFYDSSRNGLVYVNPERAITIFDGDGSSFDRGAISAPDPQDPLAAPIDPFFQQGGDGTPQRDYVGDLQSEQDRYTFNVLFTHQLWPHLRTYADLKYSRARTFTRSQPTFDYFLRIDADNPFIPPSIAAASDPGSYLLISRDNFDLGIRAEDIERTTYRSVLGVDGEIWKDVQFDASIVFGRTEVENDTRNNRYNDRFAAAVDAVMGPDGPTCRSNLDPTAMPSDLADQGWNGFEPLPGTWAGSFTPGPGSGCVPVDLFGEGSPSASAANFFMTRSRATSRIEQWVAQAILSGETFNWFVPDGPPMGWALGLERRIERSQSHPAPEDRRGLTFGNVLQAQAGDYTVSDLFMELNIPFAEDRFLAKSLAVDAAIRLSRYSTIGSTRTWKVGASWAIVDDMTLRATRARATRAPNVGELFHSGGQAFEFIEDPCDASRVSEGTAYRAANCEALLNLLGVDPATYTDPNSSAIAGTLRGNRELDEEDADTRTIGIVLQPRFAPGLSVALDWYDIEIADAINFASPQEAADICVDSPSLDNAFCALQTREPGTGGIIGFLRQPLNVARFTTRGYDLSLLYLIDPFDFGARSDLGRFRIRLVGNKLQELSFINLPGTPPDADAGEGPREDGRTAPEWQLKFDLSWYRRQLEVDYGFSYHDRTRRFTRKVLASEPDAAERRFFDYEARWVHDLFAAYSIKAAWKVYVGVSNLLDNEPAVGEVDYPVSPVGRFFFAGFEAELF